MQATDRLLSGAAAEFPDKRWLAWIYPALVAAAEAAVAAAAAASAAVVVAEDAGRAQGIAC